MKRKLTDVIAIFLILFVAGYLGGYIFLRETHAYKLPTTSAPVAVSGPSSFGFPAKTLKPAWGFRLQKFYRPLIWVDRKFNDLNVTFTAW